MTFDIVVETVEGLHILIAAVHHRQHGVMVAEALYAHHRAKTQPGRTHVRYVWLRDMTDPQHPQLLDAWPEYWKDQEGWQASVAAWHASPRGVSGSPEKIDPENRYREGLTFYGLVAALEKLQRGQMQEQMGVRHVEQAYPGLERDARFHAIETQIAATLLSYEHILQEYRQRNEAAHMYSRKDLLAGGERDHG